MTREQAMHRAVADACLGGDAGEALAHDLRGFLETRGVSPEDVEAVLAAPRRLGVYRSLVRNGISAVVARVLRRTRAAISGHDVERFGRDLARFLDQRGARTHYLRDVPEEFFTWVCAEWRADDRLPAHVPDLAAFEIAFFAASTADRRGPEERFGEIALDRPLAFDPSARLVRLDFAVHELEDDGVDPPPRRPVALLAYRDAAHAVRWLELTPVAAAVIERLLEGAPLGSAIAAACVALSSTFDPAEMARVLADLGDRAVVLGAETA
jgi:hypothetical protein